MSKFLTKDNPEKAVNGETVVVVIYGNCPVCKGVRKNVYENRLIFFFDRKANAETYPLFFKDLLYSLRLSCSKEQF